jgi:hypothetical protein
MKQKLFIYLFFAALLTLIIAPAFAQKKEIYFATGPGITIGGYPSLSIATGYSFGKYSFGIYNQIGTNFIKFGTIEGQINGKISDKVSVNTLIGFTILNNYTKTGQFGREIQSTGKHSIDGGIVLKRKIIGNINGFCQLRGSLFYAMNYKKQKELLIVPITVVIGLSN